MGSWNTAVAEEIGLKGGFMGDLLEYRRMEWNMAGEGDEKQLGVEERNL